MSSDSKLWKQSNQIKSKSSGTSHMCMSWEQLGVGDIVIQIVSMGVSEIVIAIVNLKHSGNCESVIL